MPIKSGPEAQLKKWLQSYGPLLPSFDRQSLRKWKAAHPGQRSFTVLRHPLARAYTAWCDYRGEGMDAGTAAVSEARA